MTVILREVDNTPLSIGQNAVEVLPGKHRLLVEQFASRGPGEVFPPDLGQRIQHLRICIDYFADRLDDAQRGVDAWLVEHPAGIRADHLAELRG